MLTPSRIHRPLRKLLVGAVISLSLVVPVAGCVTAPATYELCNETGTDAGCGDAVEVVIVNEG